MKKYLLSVFTLVCASFMAWAAVNAAGDTTTFGENGSYYTENADGSYTVYLGDVADIEGLRVWTDQWNSSIVIPWQNANVKVTFHIQ